MAEYRRRLPHKHLKEQWLFVTWNLHGCLPKNRYPPSNHPSAGKTFVWMDRYLDVAQEGPLFLRQFNIAKLVVESLFRGQELGHYELKAFVVMANHVHLLLLPHIDPPRLLRAIKGTTARYANLALHRTGEPFWQAESYDHWVRDAQEFDRIVAYIENNPVKAGLVMKPQDFPWSSAAIPVPEVQFDKKH